MLNLSAHLLLGGASTACGFAALGVALYAGSPAQAAAAVLFAGIGFATGLACGALHAAFDRPQALPSAALASDALAALVRETLAGAGPAAHPAASAATNPAAIADRSPRAGSAADRRPSAADVASAALAGAAAAAARITPAAPVETQRFASSRFGA